MRNLLKIVPWLGMVGFGYLAVQASVGDWWDASTDAHSMARRAYFADLAYEGCVGRDAVIAAAEARDWNVVLMVEPLNWCHTPTGLTDWVHVDVSPPLPFSTEGENAAYIAFDANGCMAEWSYDSGPGSTCPTH